MLCRGWGYTAGRGCETVASVAAGRGVSFSSSSLGLSCAFSSIWACGQLTGVFSWAAPERRSLWIVEEGDGGGHGWGLKRPTWVEFFVVFSRRGRHKGQGMHWASSLGVSHQCHSALWWFRLPPQASRLQSSSHSPIPSGCFLKANLNPLPGSALWTPHFSTQPLSAAVGVPLRLGGQGRGQDPVCRSHSVLLPHWLPCSLPQRMRLSFCRNWVPWWGVPRMWRLLLTFMSPLGCRPHPTSSPLPFASSFSCPTWLSRNLSCPFRLPRASASVQLGSVKIFPFLFHLWRDRWSPDLPMPLASRTFCLYFIFKLANGHQFSLNL